MAAPSQHVLGIDPKMYRHFAVLTMVISLTVAFLANGEQDRAAREQQAPAARADKKPRRALTEEDILNGGTEDPSPVKSSAPPPPAPPPLGEEDRPLTIDVADDGQFHPPRFTYHRPALRPDPALLAKMTPEQRKGYLKALALREQQEAGGPGGGGGTGGGGSGGGGSGGGGSSVGGAQGAVSQQQVNRLVAASRARSGGGD